MSNSDLLTIVCPVTKAAGHLSNLRVWVQQAITRGFRVIIVHDYRDTLTSMELKEFLGGLKSNLVYFVEGEFGSAGAARNAGFQVVQTRYVCFWDSDDIPLVHNLANSLHLFKDSDIVVGQFQKRTLINEQEYRVANAKTTRNMVDVAGEPGIWRFVFSVKVIRRIRFPEFPLGEDQAFLAQLPWKVLKVSYCPNWFYVYLKGGSRQTTSDFSLRARLQDSVSFLEQLVGDHLDYEFIRMLIFKQRLTILKSTRVTDLSAFLKASILIVRALQALPRPFSSLPVLLFR